MNRRRTRPNWFRIILLCLLVLGGAYINRFIIAVQPSPFEPTATVTHAPEAFITQGEELFKEGKLIPAIDAYQQAIISRPADPAIHVALARVLVFAGQYDKAKTSAEDAILLNPDSSMAHAVLAWALDFQGKYPEADNSIQRAIQLDPNNALAHAYYVEILVDSFLSGISTFESIEKAIEESKVAVALAPDTLETHRARGYILEATANYEEAIREYQAAIAINPNIGDLHLALGRNYRTLGIYDQAVLEFTNASALNSEDPTPDYLISRTYATIGEYGKAMQYAESAMTKNPEDANLRGNLGVMYYRNGYWSEAVVELDYVVNGGFTEDGVQIEQIVLIPDPRIAEYYFTHGLALARLNRCGEALLVAQTILARVPADELAVENANEINNRCQQNLNDGPTAVPTLSETDSVSTQSPDDLSGATPTPTP